MFKGVTNKKTKLVAHAHPTNSVDELNDTDRLNRYNIAAARL